MQNLSPEGSAHRRRGREPPRSEPRGGVRGAQLARAKHGSQAQFNHPDLGGMGQWSGGGMIMIGDMFNQGLKHRVDALCNELAGLVRSNPRSTPASRKARWRGQSVRRGIGFAEPLVAAGTGRARVGRRAERNAIRIFPALAASRSTGRSGPRIRLGRASAVGLFATAGRRSIADLHQPIRRRSLADLPLVRRRADRPRSVALCARRRRRRTPQAAPSAAAVAAPTDCACPRFSDDVLRTMERLAELRRKDILTEEEFSAEKAELLARL